MKVPDPTASTIADAPAPADAALALLFVGGELSPVDRQDVETRLAADPPLRDHVAWLADVDAQLRGSVESETTSIAPLASSRALEASLRLVRQQALLRRQRAASAGQRRHIERMPRWAWVAAAASIAAVAGVVWIVNSEPTAMIVAAADNDRAWLQELAPRSFGAVEAVSVSDVSNAFEIQGEIDALNELTNIDLEERLTPADASPFERLDDNATGD